MELLLILSKSSKNLSGNRAIERYICCIRNIGLGPLRFLFYLFIKLIEFKPVKQLNFVELLWCHFSFRQLISQEKFSSQMKAAASL